MKGNPNAKKAIMTAVRDQLNSSESPYVKEAYNRLIKEGHSKEEVMNMLGVVLSTEMWEISVKQRSFDQDNYIQRLEGLPDMSWLDDN
jgi:hypothetical protein